MHIYVLQIKPSSDRHTIYSTCHPLNIIISSLGGAYSVDIEPMALAVSNYSRHREQYTNKQEEVALTVNKLKEFKKSNNCVYFLSYPVVVHPYIPYMRVHIKLDMIRTNTLYPEQQPTKLLSKLQSDLTVVALSLLVDISQYQIWKYPIKQIKIQTLITRTNTGIKGSNDPFQIFPNQTSKNQYPKYIQIYRQEQQQQPLIIMIVKKKNSTMRRQSRKRSKEKDEGKKEQW
eukprot:TRINITY_DN762_c0_g1_i12.p2 TRINITY_DN762_c0_g1~~TRINITY_DN762_c0_g1_i12.p2  ORF type:complete len:231 (+),score=-4.70 TRINITY_DN762_c0_g1_i12:339-1031(+)